MFIETRRAYKAMQKAYDDLSDTIAWHSFNPTALSNVKIAEAQRVAGRADAVYYTVLQKMVQQFEVSMRRD